MSEEAELVVEGGYPSGKAMVGLLCLALVFIVPAMWFAPKTAGISSQLGDMSDATFVEIRSATGMVVMSGEVRSRLDSLGNIEKDVALLGERGERVIGEIEIEIPRAESSDQRQELEVDVISLKPRSTYHVVINDRPTATFTTDDRGSVDIELLWSPP